MKLVRLEIENFTVFEKAVFEFSSGVNVLIGENGTGKSHVLKLIYCLSEAVRRGSTEKSFQREVGLPLIEMLDAVFQPEELGHLVRRGALEAVVSATWRDGADEHSVTARLTNEGHLSVSEHLNPLPILQSSVFIPTREVLSIFPGFISSYVRRESSFDRTIYDLCLALDAKPLRKSPDEIRKKLLDPIEEVLGGEIVNSGGRFYLRDAHGKKEAPLMAEGVRKLGMLDYLIANGSLTENGFLLWDEPEASLNPKLIRLTSQVAIELARSGIQIWIATHDYLLTSELALHAEDSPISDTAFFGLVRPTRDHATEVERGDKLADLRNNAILDAVSDLHRREELSFRGDAT